MQHTPFYLWEGSEFILHRCITLTGYHSFE